ncbi:MAG: 16S rRNA (adenine(1518)-N(6)/adenine(1519)-N(6))-dimethyltransferase RsmA [Bacteroidetes bacterium]|nr:16S rRNA (adenine(1518)-N(6)/adenine(1519)-N(6))-dimethyltransferase RsmA [Bacteroidota bacterium]
MQVRAKKHLGQHFLKDEKICERISTTFSRHQNCHRVLEIGPGMGALSQYLFLQEDLHVVLMDIDEESVNFLHEKYPEKKEQILYGDFLRLNPDTYFPNVNFSVVGNFPYNISSQILFKCLEFRNRIPEIMGMFQKEVAVRVAERPGSKEYGITSVLLQAFYDIEYCFTVDEHVFSPPPKVKSGVIRCTRNNRESLSCDERLFFQVVKMAFNQRRKTLRNSLKQLLKGYELPSKFQQERPEQLGVSDFEELTLFIESIKE